MMSSNHSEYISRGSGGFGSGGFGNSEKDTAVDATVAEKDVGSDRAGRTNNSRNTRTASLSDFLRIKGVAAMK
jgi:hypothetical protein